MAKKPPKPQERIQKRGVDQPRPFSAQAMGDDAKFKGTPAPNTDYRGGWNDIPGLTPIKRK